MKMKYFLYYRIEVKKMSKDYLLLRPEDRDIFVIQHICLDFFYEKANAPCKMMRNVISHTCISLYCISKCFSNYFFHFLFLGMPVTPIKINC